MDKREIFDCLIGCKLSEDLTQLEEAEEALDQKIKTIPNTELRNTIDCLIGTVKYESIYKGFLITLQVFNTFTNK